MKHAPSLLAAAAAALLLLPSCDGGKARQISDMDDLSSQDSLVYYYGAIRAADYWHNCESDTLLRGDMARNEYIKGVIAGVNALKPDNKAYNDGFRAGVRTAIVMMGYEEDYDCTLDKEVFESAFRYGMEKEGNVDGVNAQDEYFRVKMNIARKVQSNYAKDMLLKLAEEASIHKFIKINDRIYYDLYSPGHGPLIRVGDVVYVAVTYARMNGLNLGMPSPEQLTVGSAAMPEVVTDGYLKLRKGASARFMTTAGELWGDRSELIGLEPSALVMVSVKVKDVISTPQDPDTALYLQGNIPILPDTAGKTARKEAPASAKTPGKR